jgi:flagellar basal-body rod protein FlgB
VFSSDNILGNDFRVMAAGLDGLVMRQKAHSENLANVDTPGYRRRDVDFESTLRSALNDDRNPFASSATALPGAIFPSPTADGRESASLASRFRQTQNGGAVDRYSEVGEMMNDNIRYRVLTQQVTNRLSLLRTVISEMGRG